MQTILAGSAVSLSIPVVDTDMNEVRATAAQLFVYDENDVLMLGPIAADLTDLSQYDYAVSSTITTLPAGATRGLRRFVLQATTVDLSTVQITYYLRIDAVSQLVIPTNSWLTMSQAVMLAFDIPNLDGWNSASETDRTAALKDAWYQMARMRFNQAIDLDNDQTRIVYPWSDFDFLRISLSQWNSADTRFKTALTRGQLMQADYLLSPDEAASARRSGVMQKRVGESSEMFRTTKPYEGPLCPRTMREVNRYLDRKITIGRS